MSILPRNPLDDFALEENDDLNSVMHLTQEDVEEVFRLIIKEGLNEWQHNMSVARIEFDKQRNDIRSAWKREKRMKKKRKRERRRPTDVKVNTLFKRKGVKVHPVDDHPSDGTTPEGDPYWKEKRWELVQGLMEAGTPYSDFITPKFSLLEKGERLTSERMQGLMDQVEDILKPEEKKIFQQILWNREASLAWDFDECGMLDPIVAPPQVLKVIDHKAWQAGAVPIPPGLQSKVVDLLKQRMKRRILEEGHGPYRNPYMLVAKKDGGIRLINSATRINRYTIRDSLMPPSSDEFSADVAMCQMLSLLDFFSGYDQVPLDEKSRDLTTFNTPLGLLRMCTLPQGATNSVAQFSRIITRILFDLLPDVCRAFLDDIVVKGPKTTYEDKQELPGVRKYVLEHLINLDKTLVNIELSGCTISAAKSQFCQNTAVVVGYVCGTYGRSLEEAKVIKITEWNNCDSVTEIRSFLGVVGYYRCWVQGYALITRPLTEMLKKDAEFHWGPEQAEAMRILKERITTAPILVTLDCSEGAGEVILMTDASLLGWGCVLLQVINGKRHPIRFESGLWNPAEQRYDATKRECRAVLYAIRRLRGMLYGIQFTIETDSLVLVHQLNGKADDIPGALVIRWISYILLFDFTVRHVKGIKNGVADGLSRKRAGPSDQLDREGEGDIEEWVDLHLCPILVGDGRPAEEERVLEPSIDLEAEKEGLQSRYEGKWLQLAEFLCTMQRPQGITRGLYAWIRKEAKRHFVRGGRLWRRNHNVGEPYQDPILVMTDPKMCKQLIRHCHIDQGHKGRDATVAVLRRRYWWPGMWSQVEKAIKVCSTCQEHSNQSVQERAIPTAPGRPMMKVHMDAQYLKEARGSKYLLEARCDLTGWVEAKASPVLNVSAVKVFVRDLISRWGVIAVIVVDNGSELQKDFSRTLRSMGARVIPTSAYNPKANGLIEQGHQSLAGFIKRRNPKRLGLWPNDLGNVLLADRSTPRASHGHSPYYLINGYEPVLPLEVDVPTWRTIDWDDVRTHDQMIEARLQVIARMQDDVEEAREKVTAYRRKLAERTDKSHPRLIRKTPIEVGDLVLRYDMKRASDLSREAKFQKRWIGPYRVISKSQRGSYRLMNPNGPELLTSIHGNHLKLFRKDTEGFWVCDEDDQDPRFNERIFYNKQPRENASDAEQADQSDSAIEKEQEEENAIVDDGGDLSDDEDEGVGRLPAPFKRSHMAPFEIVLPQLEEAAKAEYTSIRRSARLVK
jgi:hypothetical protein